MRFGDFRDNIRPGDSFEFGWVEVDNQIPDQVNFWLTHYTDDGSGDIKPVKLTDRPVNPHNEDSISIPGETTRQFVCANNYKIWCLKAESDPENDKSPFCESRPFQVICDQGSRC
ncbi:hypothetical protein BDW74DRAFT_183281 [Aspergillus multicolor]|uniref:uncharacterized protein n=1 Tax=Aspergillus multicolor TaxID=41759 RepID=UPI003CCDD214